MIKGFDTVARIDFDQALQLRSLGYEYALRYCVPQSYGKALTKAEADAILSAGLSLGLCWETTANVSICVFDRQDCDYERILLFVHAVERTLRRIAYCTDSGE